MQPDHSAISLASAEVIVPIVLEYVQPKRVLDIGCSRGEWLSVFVKHGATPFGYDREIPLRLTNNLGIVDLTEELVGQDFGDMLEGEFDLAVCLETAEHLPAAVAAALVKILTRAASVVLFSAAIPGQGGYQHINEQPHAYWRELFAQHHFEQLDAIRPFIKDNEQVAWWYRQNIFLFIKRHGVRRIRTSFK